ncbi:MAG: type IV secretion system protein [Alphaproteobacteria bacterium]|nr:type IV secretion system protein [Alphaproteobacteria bacterium]
MMGIILTPFRLLLIRLMFGCLALCLLSACASSPDGSPICTGSGEFNKESFYSTLAVTADGNACNNSIDAAGCRGPIQFIMENLTVGLKQTSEALFRSIVYGEGAIFRNIASRVILLYFVIYGIMLAIGMTKVTLGDGLMRAFKVGIIAFILSADGSAGFYNISSRLFFDGTDWMINKVNLQMASVNEFFMGGGEPSGSAPAQGSTLSEDQKQPAWQAYTPSDGASSSYGMDRNAGAFANVDILLSQLVATPTVRFYLACLYAFPFGWFFLFLLLTSFFFLISAIGGAIWLYLLSYIIKAVLLALGPIFIVFLLFQRTFQYFDAWMKQLIMFSLQPIVIFFYITMFMILLHVSINDMFFGPQEINGQNVNRMNVCLMPGPVLIFFQSWIWQFAMPDRNPIASSWGISGFTMVPYPFGEFPLRLEDMLIVFAICWIAKQFQDFIADITMELATVYTHAGRIYGPRIAKVPLKAFVAARETAAHYSPFAFKLDKEQKELEKLRTDVEKYKVGTAERTAAKAAYKAQVEVVKKLTAEREKAMAGINAQRAFVNAVDSQGWGGATDALRKKHGFTMGGAAKRAGSTAVKGAGLTAKGAGLAYGLASGRIDAEKAARVGTKLAIRNLKKGSKRILKNARRTIFGLPTE